MTKVWYILTAELSDGDSQFLDEVSGIQSTFASLEEAKNAIQKNMIKIKNIKFEDDVTIEKVSIVLSLIRTNGEDSVHEVVEVVDIK